MDAFIRSQIAKAPAEQMKQKYQLDVNNAEQMNQFVSAQVEQQSKSFVVNKKIRDHVFNSSLNTSFILILIAAGYFLCQPY